MTRTHGVPAQRALDGVCDAASRCLQLFVGMPAAAIMCLVMAALTVASVVVTAYPQYFGCPPMYMSAFGSLGMVRQVVVPVAVAVVWLLVLRVLQNRVLPRLATRTVVLASLAVALVVQVVWTTAFMTNYNSFADVKHLDALAKSLLIHDPEGFVGIDEWVFPYAGEASGYLLRTPYQAGEGRAALRFRLLDYMWLGCQRSSLMCYGVP